MTDIAAEVADERSFMSKGRLLKARFPDQSVPNVSWFWVALGNCKDCVFYVPSVDSAPPQCLNPDITDEEFGGYLFNDQCPEFKVGMTMQQYTHPYEGDEYDAMRAAGLAKGQPSQSVEILQNLPWSADLSEKAHAQQEQFVAMADLSDSGNDNLPGTYEYQDQNDDLGDIA